MKTYKEKLEYSEKMHKKICHWYDKNYKEWEVIPRDTLMQKYGGIDIIAVDDNKKLWWIDEKVVPVKKVWPTLAIETEQNGFSKNPGWIYTSRSDLILWLYDLGKKCQGYLIDLPRLRQYYFKNKDRIEHRTTTWGKCANTHPTNAIVEWSILKDIYLCCEVEIKYKGE